MKRQARLLHWTRADRLKSDLSESLLVLGKVLSKDVEQRLGLLRAQIDALLVLDDHVIRRRRVGKTEKKENVPDADTNLHAVGVGFAIIGTLGDGKRRL
jgi:hypothetical protein